MKDDRRKSIGSWKQAPRGGGAWDAVVYVRTHTRVYFTDTIRTTFRKITRDGQHSCQLWHEFSALALPVCVPTCALPIHKLVSRVQVFHRIRVIASFSHIRQSALSLPILIHSNIAEFSLHTNASVVERILSPHVHFLQVKINFRENVEEFTKS